MKFVNLTPHDVVVRLEDGKEFVFPKTGQEARVSTSFVQVGEIDGIPIVEQTFGDLQGLPEPQPDTIYIVSGWALTAAKQLGRTDVVAPDTAPGRAFRNESGQIVAVPAFVR